MWHCRSSVRNCPAPTTSPAAYNFLCTIGASPRQSHGLRIRSSFVAYNGLTHRRADESHRSRSVPTRSIPRLPRVSSLPLSSVIQCLPVSFSVIRCHPVLSSVIQCHPVSSSVIQCHHRAWHGDPRLAVLRREIRGSSRLRATFARAGPGQNPLMTPRETCAHGAAGSSSSCSRGTRQCARPSLSISAGCDPRNTPRDRGQGAAQRARWYLTKPLSEIRMTKKSRDEAQTAASSGGVDPALRTDDFPGKWSVLSQNRRCRLRRWQYS